MNNPFFSVVIPTYNRASMLKEAIQSVLQQTFTNFEIIVSNDHSIDNTEDIVKQFGDHRLIYTLNTHSKGNSGNRNTGIFMARGEWISFLDDDDVWSPQKLEKVYEAINSCDNETGLIYTGFIHYNFETKREVSRSVPELKGWIQSDLLYKNYIGTPSVVTVRTDLLRNIGGFDERITHFEDGELYVRIAGISKAEYIKEPLAYFRTSNSDKVSQSSVETGLRSFDIFWTKHRALINKSPKLRHRAAARVFLCAVGAKSIPHIIKSLPWTLAGLIVDFKFFSYIARSAIGTAIRQIPKRKII